MPPEAPPTSSVGGEGRKKQPADHPPRLRVLVAYEDEYRSYRETLAAAIRTLRPHTEVVNAALAELEMMAPHADLVICSRSYVQHTEGTLAWIELPNEPEQPAKISLQEGARRSLTSRWTGCSPSWTRWKTCSWPDEIPAPTNLGARRPSVRERKCRDCGANFRRLR